MTTLEEIAARHLDADSWADEGMMLAALREAVEQCAQICERHDNHGERREDRTSSPYITTLQCAAAIRKWAEGKP